MRYKKIIMTLMMVFSFPMSMSAQSLDTSVAEQLGLVQANEVQYVEKSSIKPSGLTPNLHRTQPYTETGIQKVSLTVGQLHELVFPGVGEFQIKEKHLKDLQLFETNNSIFIEPKRNIDGKFIARFIRSGGKDYVLELQTVDSKVDNIIIIDKPEQRSNLQTLNSSIKFVPAPGPPNYKAILPYDRYANLVSFGSRVAYAPDRLVEPLSGIQRTKNALPENVVKHLFRHKGIRTSPLSSWQQGELVLHLLEISNTSNTDIQLTPDLVRGNFIAKAFQHNNIGIDKADKYTTVYLIENVGMNQQLGR